MNFLIYGKYIIVFILYSIIISVNILNVNTYQALELMAEILADQTHLLKSTEIIQDGVSK